MNTTTNRLPLEGIRVVEFCWVWSGPTLGQHLADLGAEVVKVEWYSRFDLYRTRGVEHLRGSLPEPVRRESSYSFHSLNRNKLGFSADLKTEGGLDLVKSLIRESDILLENFTVGTLERLGLGADILKDLNEQLVVVSLSATGRGSSIEAVRGYGLMLSALGGYESCVIDKEGGFMGSPMFVMSDPNAGMFGVLAALAGVLHARRSGRGATFECSQVEAVATVVAAPDPPGPAPLASGIFSTSDGSHIAATIPAMAADMPATTDALAAWVNGRTAAQAIGELRRAGAHGVEVQTLRDSETSAEFAGGDVRQTSVHPVTGTERLVATPWRINGARSPIRKSAPLLGESNEYVLRHILGLSEEEIAAVHDSGVVDERPAN